MKLRQTIELLNSAMKFGNISEAADSLGIDRTAASKRIAKFEKDIGVCFFDRQKNRVTSTVDGERIQKTLEVLVSQLKENKKHDDDQLKLSTTNGIASETLPFIIGELNESFGNIRYKIVINDFDNVPDGILDVLIGNKPAYHPDYTTHKLKVDWSLGLYAHPDYLSARGVPETIDDLADHDLITYSDFEDSSAGIGAWITKLVPGDKSCVKYIVPSASAMINLCLEGFGIAALTAKRSPRCSQLARVLPEYSQHNVPIYVTYKVASISAHKIRRLISALEKKF